MMANLTYFLGLLLCGIAGLQAFVYLVRSTSGLLADRRANNLRVELLNSQIQAARSKHQVQKESTIGWEGFRKFRVTRKDAECDGAHSFYLAPHDGKALPSFSPGQYLTFQFRVPGEPKPVIRCYSLSDAPGRDYYRCTIKKVPSPRDKPELPSGRASTYMNEQVAVGDILDVKAPRGNFFLDMESDRPIVLLAGGVGITPMLSMMNAIALSGSNRKAILFYGVMNSLSHIARQEIAALCDSHSNLEVVTCYSDQIESDVQGRHYDVGERVSIDLLRTRLGPTANMDYDFYLCGPGGFMAAITDGLEAWGVPAEAVHTEAFGPSSVKKKKPVAVGAGAGAGAAGGELPATPMVQFGRSGKQLPWNPECDSLLDFAEAAGIEVESGCRAGNCGTCVLAVKAGTVTYTEEPSSECEKGNCLPCVCVPAGPLVLDA